MSKNIVPCGGFELDDTLTIDKNGKLGVSDIVVFKGTGNELGNNKELRTNMDISSIFDILKKSNNDVHFILLIEEEEANIKLCANAISYSLGIVPDKGLMCIVLFMLLAGDKIMHLQVTVDKEKNKAILTLGQAIDFGKQS